MSVTIPSSLLPSMEASAGQSANALTWLDWWVGGLFEFEDSLPVGRRELFHRVVVSGGRTLDFAARHSVGTYTNLLLLHRDRLVEDFSPEVPIKVVSALRNAELLTDPLVCSSGSTASAADKKRSATQDALVMQALTAGTSWGPSSPESDGGGGGAPEGSPDTGTPVVPEDGQGSSSNPAPSSGRGRKRKRGKKTPSGQSSQGGSSSIGGAPTGGQGGP